MRKLIGMMSLCALVATIGCRHVGGKCDCQPLPGEATTYTPYNNYQATQPVVTPPKTMPKADTLGAPKVLPKT